MADQDVLSIAQVGAQLRWARRTARMTIADVAERTKVSTYYLLALENEEFTRLPSRVHTFGFARAFANAVKANEGQVMDALRDQLDREKAERRQAEAEAANVAPRRKGISGLLRSMASF